MAFDAKTDTPVAATAVASADKFVFGDVSADGWETILAENVLDALIRLSAGGYYVYTAGKHTLKDGAGSYGKLLVGTLIEANTAGSGSPNILTELELRTLLTNEGTGAQNYHTLPAAVAGLDFEFVVQNAYGIRIVANTGDTIRDGDIVSAAAGYLASTKIGSVVRVKAINATEWVVVYKSGHWTVDGLGSVTATQLTGNADNYAPSTASFLRISSDAARDITGLVAGMDGEQRVFLNVGSYAITLKHESASSTAANRFTCATAADIAIDAGSIVALVYDGTSARWRAR